MLKIKSFIFLFVFISTLLSVDAQSVFKKGNIGLNSGIGLGWSYEVNNNRVDALTPVPSVNLSVEYGIYKIPNVGLISVGAIATYRNAKDVGSRTSLGINYDYDYTFKNTILAVRSVYHAGFFDSGGFDFYAGFQLGVRLSNYTYDVDYEIIFEDQVTEDNTRHFVHDVFIGGRYFFTDNFGFFSEIAYGTSYFKFGVSLKF